MTNFISDYFRLAFAIRPAKVKRAKRLPCKVYSKEEIAEINKRLTKTTKSRWDTLQKEVERLDKNKSDLEKENTVGSKLLARLKGINS